MEAGGKGLHCEVDGGGGGIVRLMVGGGILFGSKGMGFTCKPFVTRFDMILHPIFELWFALHYNLF